MAQHKKKPQARRLEVRLLRRLPAQPARLRGRAAGGRRRGRHRLFPRGDPRRRQGPLRPLAGRGLDHHARTTPSASTTCARRSQAADHHRRLRDRGRHPGAAQLRRRAGISSRSSMPSPSTSDTLATSTPIADHVPVDFELRGCPINKRQLLEVHRRLPGRARSPTRRRTASAWSASCKGNVCVMVAHGTPCLGPGHPCRLRRALPGLQPRLLRLLRADGDAEHALAQPPAGARSA